MPDLQFSLKVVAGPGTSNSCVLSHERPLSFGRLETNDCVLSNDAAISRKHFEIRFQNGKCWIKDLNSRNGTFLNNYPILTSELKQNDEIRVGGTRLVVNMGEANVSHITPSGARLVAKSKIAITDDQSTTVYSAKQFHSGKITKKKVVEGSFLTSFLDLPGAAILISAEGASNFMHKFPEAAIIDEQVGVVFPQNADDVQTALGFSFGSDSFLFLNHTSGKSQFVHHLKEFSDTFGSPKFLDEYQELPTELSCTLMNGIDLVVCNTEVPEVSAVIFDKRHAHWLGDAISENKE